MFLKDCSPFSESGTHYPDLLHSSFPPSPSLRSGPLCLISVCSVPLSIYWWGSLFFGRWGFWSLCIFQVLILSWKSSWQRFLSHSGGCCPLYWPLAWLCRSFSLRGGPIWCWFFYSLCSRSPGHQVLTCASGSRNFLVLSFRSFPFSGLTRRSSIHFKLILHRVRDRDLVSVFYKWRSGSPCTICERLSFLQCVFPVPLSRTRWLWLSGFISGSSVLSPWSTCLLLYESHAAFVAVAL